LFFNIAEILLSVPPKKQFLQSNKVGSLLLAKLSLFFVISWRIHVQP